MAQTPSGISVTEVSERKAFSTFYYSLVCLQTLGKLHSSKHKGDLGGLHSVDSGAWSLLVSLPFDQWHWVRGPNESRWATTNQGRVGQGLVSFHRGKESCGLPHSPEGLECPYLCSFCGINLNQIAFFLLRLLQPHTLTNPELFWI